MENPGKDWVQKIRNTMYVKYLSKGVYNGSSERINDRVLKKTIEKVSEEYKYLSKGELLKLLAYKTVLLIRSNITVDLLEEYKSLSRKHESLLEEKVSLLEDNLGKKAEFFNRNKKPTLVVQFK